MRGTDTVRAPAPASKGSRVSPSTRRIPCRTAPPNPSPLGQAGYVPDVERLGIPPLRLADGPAGVRVTRHASALTAPVLPASAFDPEQARRYG
ncbi:hypothetical protein [Streptomyces coeruleorubidus]|uniref:hypothetical protein n=1 Tax=Streptomyces coeruleorubidus TaxID=116188 RepID=UPI0033DF2376